MSWGERSCIYLYAMPEARKCKPEINSCNVNCPLYKWDNETTPDSLTHVGQIRKDIADGKLEETGIVCHRGNKWDKKKGNKLFNNTRR